jgi:hypothetical protein
MDKLEKSEGLKREREKERRRERGRERGEALSCKI